MVYFATATPFFIMKLPFPQNILHKIVVQHIFFLVWEEKQMQTNNASEQQDGIVCWSCTLLIWVQRNAKNKQRI